MIGVIIPAHNEQALLAACLESVLLAAGDERLQGEQVCIAVVLDACEDTSGDVAGRYPVQRLESQARNVGIGRALGADWLIGQGARWLASTDADTRVASDWLALQIAYEADAVCGVVEVDDWSEHGALVRSRYDSLYQDREGHSHVHGANLGIAVPAYLAAGGFPPLACDEDVQLVQRLQAQGARIVWSREVRVCTSARLECRARGGFGDFLRGLDGLTA